MNNNSLKILPLGGSDGVTKNLFVYEWQDERLLVDCGIGFPEEEMLGVDLLIPDVDYLVKNPKKIHGVVISHGHDDHLAGLPYILPKIGQVPIYASKLTAGFIKDTYADFDQSPKINVFKETDQLNLGPFKVDPIHVTHSVPDAMHLVIDTPVGAIYHGSDFKFDLTPVDNWPSNFQKISKFGQRGIKCLLTDCLRVEREGFSKSESTIKDNFLRELRKCKGRFVVTLMSSSIHRLQQAVEVAASFGRKIAFVGYSLETKVKTATRLGFFKPPKNMIINKRKIQDYPPHKVAIMIAGSQGQVNSSLSRLSNDEHSYLKVEPGDRVVFSADPIPGNERAVYRAIDNFLRLGVDVVHSEVTEDLHVSGHGSQGDLKLLVELAQPEYIMPIGGEFRHLHFYKRMVKDLGYHQEKVFILKNGESINLSQKGKPQTRHEVNLKDIFVDGSRIGDVGPIVLSDRQRLSQDGIVTIIVKVNSKSKQPLGQPQVVSRGFVFMKEAGALVNKIKDQVKKHYSKKPKSKNHLKNQIEKEIFKMVRKETGREPLVMAAIVEV